MDKIIVPSLLIIVGVISAVTVFNTMYPLLGQSTDAMSSMQHRMDERLKTQIEASAQAAQQIVAGVEQQTIGLDQIVIGMNDINQAAQQSAAGATQSQKAAQDMNAQAEQLKQVVAQYRM